MNYTEYENEWEQLRAEFIRLRSEYQVQLDRLKTEENAFRAEFHKRKDELFARMDKHHDVYRENISKNF